MHSPSILSIVLLLSFCWPSLALALHGWVDSLVIYRACEIGHGRSGCRGLIATRDLRRGEKVLTVAQANTISVDRHTTDGDETPWLSRLALVLAEEMHAGADSDHGLFIRSLPAPPFAPHRWSEEDLMQLQNRTLVSEAVARRQLLADEYQRIAHRTVVSERTFAKAWELAASRVVGARGEGGKRSEKLMLVPVLDMANHAPSIGGQLEFDRATGDVSLVTTIDLRKGDEILLDYGARPNDEFLLQYGFVPDHNPNDDIPVTLQCGGSIRVSWDDARTADVSVREACERALEAMPTSLAEDAATLASTAARGSPRATALRYRIAKKSLLSAVAGLPASSATTSAFAC